MPRRYWLLPVLFAISLAAEADPTYGHYEGTVKAEWLRGTTYERRMQLLEDFVFVDGKGKRWLAPKGTKTDGATIPQALWSWVAAPLDGQWREAAVIHDAYCESQTEPWKDTHRIFYYGMRTSDVNVLLAKLMYGAVVGGGKRWGGDESKCSGCHKDAEAPPAKAATVLYTEADARALKAYIDANDPTLDQIDIFVEAQRVARMAHP